jgi:leader peptidase (prepilin peptidase)/N-methyltransferase
LSTVESLGRKQSARAPYGGRVLLLAVILAAVLGAIVGAFAPEISLRTCGLEIPARRALYAVTSGLLSAVTAWGIGLRWLLAAWLFLALVGAVLSFIDLAHHRLPDRLVLPSYPITIMLLALSGAITGEWQAVLRGLLAAVAMFAAYFLLALIYPAGMGMGDVKLAGVLGLGLGYLGWGYVFIGFLAAFFLGSFVGIALLALRKVTRKTAIPFGPFMVLGAVLAVLVGGLLAELYSGSGGGSATTAALLMKH